MAATATAKWVAPRPALVSVVMGTTRINNVDKLALMNISDLAQHTFTSDAQINELSLPEICDRHATFTFLQWSANGYYSGDYSMGFLADNSFAANLDLYVTAVVLGTGHDVLIEIQKSLFRVFTAKRLSIKNAMALDQFLARSEDFQHPHTVFGNFAVQACAHRVAHIDGASNGTYLDRKYLQITFSNCPTLQRLVKKAWAGPHFVQRKGAKPKKPENNFYQGSYFRRQLREATPEILEKLKIVPLLDENGRGTVFSAQPWGIPAKSPREYAPTEGGWPS